VPTRLLRQLLTDRIQHALHAVHLAGYFASTQAFSALVEPWPCADAHRPSPQSVGLVDYLLEFSHRRVGVVRRRFHPP